MNALIEICVVCALLRCLSDKSGGDYHYSEDICLAENLDVRQ